MVDRQSNETFLVESNLETYIDSVILKRLKEGDYFIDETRNIFQYVFEKNELDNIISNAAVLKEPTKYFKQLQRELITKYENKYEHSSLSNFGKDFLRLLQDKDLVDENVSEIFRNGTLSYQINDSNKPIISLESRIKDSYSLVNKFKFKIVEEKGKKSIKDHLGFRIVLNGDISEKELNEYIERFQECIHNNYDPLKINGKKIIRNYFNEENFRELGDSKERYKALHLYVFHQDNLYEIQVMPKEIWDKSKDKNNPLFHEHYKTLHKLGLIKKKNGA